MFLESRRNIVLRFLASVDNFNPSSASVRLKKSVFWIKPQNLIAYLLQWLGLTSDYPINRR